MTACVLGMPCAAAGAALTPATAPDIISVGVFTVAPYVMAGPDGPEGALIEFFDREIAPRMGVRFRWERPTTVARLEQSLISGRVMFTPIMLRTSKRDKARIRFAGEVYIRFHPCLAVLPGHRLDQIASPADLAGMTVGWVQAGALPSFMLDKRIKLDRIGSVDWTPANLEKLRLGRIEAAYFSNHYTPQYFAARTGMKLKILTLPTRGLSLQGAFAPGTPTALLERFQRAADQAFAHERFNAYVDRALAAEPEPAATP
ncbi:transporter substrate-binding domain-containing protein [Massilia sp. PAMC28688]|uniref:substrate-binding periplasmic protein n=1 Tax=Massilia sp. PAMC28688 TaxID=2861283 RepID=UPI001C633513|nr:transporter substrate-binding domain-containing protein [Massilia sp. PAMC28688]QYF92783.1 transporter substrate-binding domain-containing protein [Massilia sp. PAMC28688]